MESFHLHFYNDPLLIIYEKQYLSPFRLEWEPSGKSTLATSCLCNGQFCFCTHFPIGSNFLQFFKCLKWKLFNPNKITVHLPTIYENWETISFSFQMRMRTLERKKSSASRLSNGGGHQLNSLGNGHRGQTMQGQNGHNGGQQEKNEFDDLISALRTGDVFGENMDKFKRSRKIRHSPPRVDRVDSFLRERESNGLNQAYHHPQHPRHK